MKTTDFNPKITSHQLNENLYKKFGVKVKLENYSREQLENYRNLLRTKISQAEASSNFNDLLTNEAYQKDKHIIGLLNQRIKEMLGESKKLIEKAVSRSQQAAAGIALKAKREGKKPKKGTASAAMADMSTAELEKFARTKHKGLPKHKQTDEAADHTGDGKNDFDDVQVARMVAGGVPKKKAIAKAKSDKFKEGQGEADDKNRAPAKKQEREVQLPSGAKVKATKVQGWQSQKADKDDAFKEATDNRPPAEKQAGTWTDKSGKAHPATKVKGWQSKKADKDAEFKEAADLPGNQEKIDVAKPKGKITGADLAALRKGKKKMKESTFKQHVKIVNESLRYFINEDEEGKAKTITAGADIVNDFTAWMTRIGQYQTKSMIELADEIRANFGPAESEQFKASVAPALEQALDTLTQVREQISQSVAALAGGASPEPMGPDMDMGAEMPGNEEIPSTPDSMNAGDEFAASDAAAGGAEMSGRERRESRELFANRLNEAHNIISKLSK